MKGVISVYISADSVDISGTTLGGSIGIAGGIAVLDLKPSASVPTAVRSLTVDTVTAGIVYLLPLNGDTVRGVGSRDQNRCIHLHEFAAAIAQAVAIFIHMAQSGNGVFLRVSKGLVIGSLDGSGVNGLASLGAGGLDGLRDSGLSSQVLRRIAARASDGDLSGVAIFRLGPGPIALNLELMTHRLTRYSLCLRVGIGLVVELNGSSVSDRAGLRTGGIGGLCVHYSVYGFNMRGVVGAGKGGGAGVVLGPVTPHRFTIGMSQSVTRFFLSGGYSVAIGSSSGSSVNDLAVFGAGGIDRLRNRDRSI